MSGPDAALLWAMLAHIALVFFLYGWLTVARVGAVRRGEVEYSCFVLGEQEPRQAARISRNLSNQFELPVIFYAAVLLIVLLEQGTLVDAIAAWVFVVGRIVHTMVQTMTENVQLRGQVFTINFA